MKTKFILFRRNGVFYIEDTVTGKQTSLRTKDETEAKSLLNARNEAHRQSAFSTARYAFVPFSSMILSANCHHYLPDMLVALEIAMRFDNVFKGKCLVDYGFQRTVGETLQHKICHFGAFFRNQYRFENANEFHGRQLRKALDRINHGRGHV